MATSISTDSFDHISRNVKARLTAGEFLEKVLPNTLEGLAGSIDFQWGVFWKVDVKTGTLSSAGIWSRDPNRTRDLERDTSKRTLASGEGMPGRAWRIGRIAWSDDLAMHMSLPRSLMSVSSGFKCGIWFPVQSATTTFGVVELLSQRERPKDPSLLKALEDFGLMIGHSCEELGQKP